MPMTYKTTGVYIQGVQKKVPPLIEFLVGITLKI